MLVSCTSINLGRRSEKRVRNGPRLGVSRLSWRLWRSDICPHGQTHAPCGENRREGTHLFIYVKQKTENFTNLTQIHDVKTTNYSRSATQGDACYQRDARISLINEIIKASVVSV